MNGKDELNKISQSDKEQVIEQNHQYSHQGWVLFTFVNHLQSPCKTSTSKSNRHTRIVVELQ